MAFPKSIALGVLLSGDKNDCRWRRYSSTNRLKKNNNILNKLFCCRQSRSRLKVSFGLKYANVYYFMHKKKRKSFSMTTTQYNFILIIIYEQIAYIWHTLKIILALSFENTSFKILGNLVEVYTALKVFNYFNNYIIEILLRS